MQARFDRFDGDGDGVLKIGEVGALLASMGFNVDSGYVQGVIATFDSDNSSGLEVGEFEKLFVFLSNSNQIMQSNYQLADSQPEQQNEPPLYLEKERAKTEQKEEKGKEGAKKKDKGKEKAKMDSKGKQGAKTESKGKEGAKTKGNTESTGKDATKAGGRERTKKPEEKPAKPARLSPSPCIVSHFSDWL